MIRLLLAAAIGAASGAAALLAYIVLADLDEAERPQMAPAHRRALDRPTDEVVAAMLARDILGDLVKGIDFGYPLADGQWEGDVVARARGALGLEEPDDPIVAYRRSLRR